MQNRMPTNMGIGRGPNPRPLVHAGAGPDVSSRRDILAGLTAASIIVDAMGPAYAESGPWSTKQFLDNLEKGKIERVVFSADGRQIIATDLEGDRHGTLILPEQASEITSALQKKDVPFNVQAVDQAQNAAGSILSAIVPPLLFVGALFLLNRNA